MGTLLPIFGWRTYATFRDDLRNEVNAWIRSAKEIDGCIDFDLALRGSQNPSAFREGFDSGDHRTRAAKPIRRWQNVLMRFCSGKCVEYFTFCECDFEQIQKTENPVNQEALILLGFLN